jgi:hypothetical protein
VRRVADLEHSQTKTDYADDQAWRGPLGVATTFPITDIVRSTMPKYRVSRARAVAAWGMGEILHLGHPSHVVTSSDSFLSFVFLPRSGGESGEANLNWSYPFGAGSLSVISRNARE